MNGATEGDTLLVGCDILRGEISRLIAQNDWPVSCVFLPSVLHADLDALATALTETLREHRDREKRVFYGTCHPLMPRILDGTMRTPGQNCVEIYLGPELFERELAAGAFFLFEEWARNWRELASRLGDPGVVKEIFAYAHNYLLAIRTPCSGDFASEALEVASHVGLELRWLDAGTEQLERVLSQTLGMQTRGTS